MLGDSMVKRANRNRLANVHNRFQNTDKHIRVLTVCSAGLLRSPTIARVLTKDFNNVNCRSVGVSQEFALIPIDEAHVEWADVIICAEKEHAVEIEAQASEWMFFNENTPIIVLDIPDSFGFADPKLESIIREKINELIETGELDFK